jgi:hypothetical protein
MTPEKRQEVQDTYDQFKLDKVTLRQKFPNKYDMDSTLHILTKMYVYIKQHHLDLPKLKKRTLQPYSKGESSSSSAICYKSKKQIGFAHRILKRRADVTQMLGSGEWMIYQNTLMLFELLTHEMSHFRIEGLHNKRFYNRQSKLFSTAINGIISGEYYN